MDVGLVFVGCHRQGGVERSVWEFARHLHARGHSATVYARDIDPAGLEGVRLVPIEVPGPALLRPMMFARSARRALQSHRHDHVISFGVGDVHADVLWVNSVHRAWLRQSLQFRERSGLRRSPVLRYLSPRHLLLLAMEWNYFVRSDPSCVVTVADAVGDDLHRLYNIRRELLETIHNGYSPDEFSPAQRRDLRNAARREFGYVDGDVVALIAANELPRKGFDVLIEAQSALKEPRLKVLLVGRTPPSDLQLAHIEDLGLSGHVQYAGSRDDMSVVHAAADLFVLPTQYEAFCLAIIEALASGLPVITSTVPGAGDRILDGENGRLLRDPRSVDELARALSEGLDDSVRASWASNAPATVAELTWESLFDHATTLVAQLPHVNSRGAAN